MTTALVIHGHFYQPPRENPWTGLVEREESAAPFHNWNERIYSECYRANAYARIVDGYGRVSGIVNNYTNISFNFGPTLLSWIEETHPRVYRRILEADRQSCKRHGGHGNAIAQAYNHMILPLANERDRRTQIRWGMADFRWRFKREPESLWLSETACDNDTIEALIDEGLKYVILSPHQAERVRSGGGSDWRDVSDGSIDPGIAYKYMHRDGSGRSIAVFFYDGTIARAIAFEGGLSSSQALVDLLSRSHGGEGRIVQTATDGESYGHHFHFGDRSLAYALEHEAVARGFWITNYGEYLEHHPPTHEVEIKAGPNGEGTAWSCAHGVGRWCRDCGCNTGGQMGWNQAWRGPLREALDHLRDRAADLFATDASELFENPWDVRDAYVDVLLDATVPPEDFLRRFVGRRLRAADQSRVLTLLEMQRHALLMYTSCGWFFSDLSGIETLQVMKYAGRVLDLWDESGKESIRDDFLDRLSVAESNVSEYGNGADIFRRFVNPSRVTRRGIVANIAFSTLVEAPAQRGEIYDHSYEIRDSRRQRLGRLTLSTGRVCLEARRTTKQLDAIFAAIHFGGVDFYCAVRPFPGMDRFRRGETDLWASYHKDPLPRILRMTEQEFGPDEYGLEHVLPDGRARISKIVFENLIRRFSEEYAHLYQENHRTLEMLHSAGFEIPAELRVAAEFTLGKRFEDEIRRQNRSLDPSRYEAALEIAAEVRRRGYRIETRWSSKIFGEMLSDAVSRLIADPAPAELKTTLELIDLSRELGVSAFMERAQEIVFDARHRLVSADGRDELLSGLGLAPGIFDAVSHHLHRET